MKIKICVILIVAFAALFSTSAYFIFDRYRQDKQQAELYDSLADMVNSTVDAEEEPAEPILYTEEKQRLRLSVCAGELRCAVAERQCDTLRTPYEKRLNVL